MKKIGGYTFAGLFDNGQVAEDEAQVEAMQQEIASVGGILHFSIEKSEGYWSAECDEIDGIITGGVGENPTNEEIESGIREAIHTAFGISSKVQSEDILRNAEEPAFKLCHS